MKFSTRGKVLIKNLKGVSTHSKEYLECVGPVSG